MKHSNQKLITGSNSSCTCPACWRGKELFHPFALQWSSVFSFSPLIQIISETFTRALICGLIPSVAGYLSLWRCRVWAGGPHQRRRCRRWECIFEKLAWRFLVINFAGFKIKQNKEHDKEIQIVLVFRKSSGGTREVEQDRAASIFYGAFKCILLVVNNESCIINDKEEVETPHVANRSHKKWKRNKSIEPVDVVVEKVLSQFCSHGAPGQAELVSVWGAGTGRWGCCLEQGNGLDAGMFGGCSWE